MSWISYQHVCESCGHEGVELHRRSGVEDRLPCPECGGAHFVRVPYCFVSTAKTSLTKPEVGGYTEGSRVRKDLKERLSLRKEARRLKREGKLAESRAVRRESKKLKGESSV